MWSSAVVIHPWVGASYESPKNVKHKTLILGESNFTKPEKFKSDLVINCVLDDLNEAGNDRDTTGFCRFSTKLRRIIFGHETAVGPSGFWQDVSFYNFVQSLVGESARIRPTQEMWESSVGAFSEIVLKLKPSRILVLGKANWDNLLQHVVNERIDQYSATLKVGSEVISASYVNHPSSSLTYATWHPVAHTLLQT